MPAPYPVLALMLLRLSKAKVPGIAALALLLATASPVHAAAPSTGSTPQSTVGTTPSITAGPPTVSNFRADGGAAVTWDNDVALTWTQQGQPKEWRVPSRSAAAMLSSAHDAPAAANVALNLSLVSVPKPFTNPAQRLRANAHYPR